MAGREDEAEIDDEEGEWRFSLSDIEEREAAADDETAGDGDVTAGEGEDAAVEDGDGPGVAGSFAPSETIEPGEINLENALFVLVGVGFGLSVVAVYAMAFL